MDGASASSANRMRAAAPPGSDTSASSKYWVSTGDWPRSEASRSARAMARSLGR